jgi:hypothetical protein
VFAEERAGWILRVLRGRAATNERDALMEFVRGHAIREALRTPGLMSYQPAVREGPDGLEIVVVSAWQSFDALAAVTRPIDVPMPLSTANGRVIPATVNHYELSLGQARLLPMRGAKLRLSQVALSPNAESAYFQHARRLVEIMAERRGMVAYLVGRRMDGISNLIATVTVWDDEEAMADSVALGDEFVGGKDLAPYYASPPTTDTFDAIVAIASHADAPAILVADDIGRYIYATLAASHLTGWPIAHLLTMRVQDIASSGLRPAVPGMWDEFIQRGTSIGQFDIHRPDGTDISVHFAAATDSPWPGCHSSVLTPLEEPARVDVAAALAQAGLVSRFSDVPAAGASDSVVRE